MSATPEPDSEPLRVPLSDQLGHEERAKLDALLDHIYECGTTAEGVLLRAAQLCQAARAAERERCAAWVEARRDAFCEEYSSIDPSTGALEFGQGRHAEAKSEYVQELEEIAAGLRAL